ncbi:jg25707 [Pararge aegeria aegeria]|uniref:Jg25707 protein n=2 Tax=Pararge aegeria TaxID=116150 RepID=A0A8S4RU29_9NEOP|nr:jg25707 [Pararge aegeria aegeria]
MHVIGILFLFILLHGNATFSWMPILDDTEILKSATASSIANNATTSAPPIQCKTARSITGLCVIRQRCDFGSGSTDFTLYAPRWYKK